MQAHPPKARKSRRRGKGGSPAPALTSHPTSRNAYIETRHWLLAEHGPICAYCGLEFSPRAMTLDHVAPRLGQSAYDRRDNLVLACSGCNAKKKDLAPLAFLLASRGRAVNLLRYGSHLSPMLVELARQLVPPEMAAVESRAPTGRDWSVFPEMDGPSPYRD